MTTLKTLAAELEVPTLEAAFKDIRDRIATTTAEQERRAHAYWLDSLLDGTSSYAIVDLIRAAMQDPTNRAELIQLTRWCESDALFARTIDELSRVYAEPPVRTAPDAYQRLCDDVQLDAVMALANRKFNAHGALIVSPRVRDGELVIDLITPAAFTAVWPNSDPTRLSAVVFDIPLPPKPTEQSPRYRVVARDATYILNQKWERLSTEPNELGELPFVLVLAAPPSATGWILPARANHDLAQADAAASFQRLNALRESLTVKKQVAISGDTSDATTAQTQASAKELFLPEGVTAQVLDRGVDGKSYLDLATAIADAAAANRGVSPELRKQAPVESGWALQLRRMPLLERRRTQIGVFRRVETQLAKLLARVIELTGLETYAFDPSAFSIEFGALTPPVDELTELQVFAEKRRLGLTDTIEEIAKRAQIDDEQATEDLATHVTRESARVELMQSLAKQNASASTPVGDASNMNRDGGPVTPAEKVMIQ